MQEVSSRDRRETQERAAETLERNRDRFNDHMAKRGIPEEQRERELRELDRQARELREEAARDY